VHRCADLPQVRRTLRTTCGLARCLDGGQKEADEYRYDANDDRELNKRERLAATSSSETAYRRCNAIRHENPRLQARPRADSRSIAKT
jgi:hypothetical protein